MDNHSGEENLQNLFFGVLDNVVNTETENIETEPSLNIVNTHLLKKEKPIYSKLVDCTDDVIVISKKVTSPLFITTLMNKLRNKNIKTIGDLAMLSETEINRLPFKVPVVANVYRALDHYYKKIYAKDDVISEQQPAVNGIVDDNTNVEMKNNGIEVVAKNEENEDVEKVGKVRIHSIELSRNPK